MTLSPENETNLTEEQIQARLIAAGFEESARLRREWIAAYERLSAQLDINPEERS